MHEIVAKSGSLQMVMCKDGQLGNNVYGPNPKGCKAAVGTAASRRSCPTAEGQRIVPSTMSAANSN